MTEDAPKCPTCGTETYNRQHTVYVEAAERPGSIPVTATNLWCDSCKHFI